MSTFARPFVASALFVCCVIARAAPAADAFQHPPLAGERVLWLGDSITQAGDYVTFVEYGLEQAYPNAAFDVVSIGRSSETLSGLSEKTHPGARPCLFDRLPRALAVVKPTVVVACYGMNDGIYHPRSKERLLAFQTGVRRLIEACHAAGARLVLLTPPPFDAGPVKTLVPASAPDFSYRAPYEGYDTVLAEFAEWELSLPAADAQVIDLHGPMQTYVAHQRATHPTFSFTRDGIHPNAEGHLLMAMLMLHALHVPVEFSEQTLSSDLAKIQADALYALVKRQRELRSAAWLAYVGLPGAIEKAEADSAKLQEEIDGLRTRRNAASVHAGSTPALAAP